MTDLPAAKTLVFIEEGLMNEVDLRFLPSFSRFITEIPSAQAYSTPILLVIVSANPQHIIPKIQPWIAKEDSSILFLWNFIKNPDIAYALSKYPEIKERGRFRTTHHTCHLLLSHKEEVETTRLTEQSVENLDHISQYRISVPRKVFRQSLWRYAYVIKAFDSLSEKDSQREKTILQLKNKIEMMEEENKNLDATLGSIKEKYSTLEAKYMALSNSKLGSLTLKKWAKKRK